MVKKIHKKLYLTVFRFLVQHNSKFSQHSMSLGMEQRKLSIFTIREFGQTSWFLNIRLPAKTIAYNHGHRKFQVNN
jgi:hypothetical protein